MAIYSRPVLKFASLGAYDAHCYLTLDLSSVYALGSRSKSTAMDGNEYSDGGDRPFQFSFSRSILRLRITDPGPSCQHRLMEGRFRSIWDSMAVRTLWSMDLGRSR